MANQIKIGNKIRALHKMKGLSQEKLAGLVNCNYKTIGNIENNRFTPDLKQVINICDVLETSLDSLLDLTTQKCAHLVAPNDGSDEYPVLVKRIPTNPKYSMEQLQNMEKNKSISKLFSKSLQNAKPLKNKRRSFMIKKRTATEVAVPKL